ncbi:MAG: TetR/AcrR family transcriptional regulator [Bdellovibrionales bacterium]|nr:TetR/AcrR family transcriptional regulator [Bdellovibrionales bacterium]
MKTGNRQRILDASIDLFNQSGTIDITTNHIARHLKISPGNLYFHFDDKEQIIRELFDRLRTETYRAWDPKQNLAPFAFLQQAFEVFWTFRFFHREMYHLRRQDPALSRLWKGHLNRCFRLLKLNYIQWRKAGWMRGEASADELKELTDSVLLSSNAFLGFFESPEKPASRKNLKLGIDHTNRLLTPYYSETYRRHLSH